MTDERKETLRNTLAINRGMPPDLLLQGIVAWIDYHYGEDSPTMMVGQLDFWREANEAWMKWARELVRPPPSDVIWGAEDLRTMIAEWCRNG